MKLFGVDAGALIIPLTMWTPFAKVNLSPVVGLVRSANALLVFF